MVISSLVKRKIPDILFFIFMSGILSIGIGVVFYNESTLGAFSKITIEYIILICLAIIGLIYWSRERNR